MNEEIDILLSRYFSGEASPEELQQLDTWLARSPQNEAYFEEMTMIFQQASGLPPMPEPDLESALNSFKEYMGEEKSIQKPLVRKLIPYLSVAASILLIFGLFLFVSDNKNEIITLNAENQMQETLFEGVDVLLAEGTEMKYNTTDKTEITLLKGEATFDVNSQESGQLQVLVGETFIKDIGTVFTVIAHDPEKSITVEVSEGEILFYTKNNPGISVKKSEKGIYYPQENYFELIKATVDVKAIEFEATSLAEVTAILSTQYNVSIKLAEPKLNELQISVSFDPADSIDDILTIIAETLNLHVINESQAVYVLSH